MAEAASQVAGWGRLRPLSWVARGPIATPVWRWRGVVLPFVMSGAALRNLDMDAFSLKFSVVQALDGIHGLIRIGHMYKSKIFDNCALCDRAVLFEESAELVVGSFLYVGHVELDGALVLPVAGLHVDRRAVQLVQVQAFDGFGGGLAVVHVDEGVVLDDGTLCDCAVLSEERLDLLLVGLTGQVSHKNLHHF